MRRTEDLGGRWESLPEQDEREHVERVRAVQAPHTGGCGFAQGRDRVIPGLSWGLCG